MTYRVLVVEDEAIAVEAHAAYVQRLAPFTLVGSARSAQEATRFLRTEHDLDLVLLDLHLPDGHGLDLLRGLRAAGLRCDVIAVTSARDLDVVRRAVNLGVFSYLLKPFTFAGFKAKLEQYAGYRDGLAEQQSSLAQDEVDAMLARRATAAPAELPKGLSPETLALVTDGLRAAPAAASASEIAGVAGTSRVTARRYLEHLVHTRQAVRETRFGQHGRPEVEYRWRG